jgi:hypothetical protein
MANFFSFVSTHIENDRDSFYLNVQLPTRNLSIGWGDINPINKSHFEIKKNIEDFYPDYKGTNNPYNGSVSLPLFVYLQPGDIVFVRGSAKIIDVVVITGHAFFDRNGHYPEDYFLKIPFCPLFTDRPSGIDTAKIPTSIYNEVLYDGGRPLVIRELSESTARILLSEILK